MNAAKTHFHGILYALAGYTIWVLADTVNKFVSGMAIPKFEILLYSSLSGMAVILASMAWRGELAKLRPKRYGFLALAGFLFTFNFICGVWVLPQLTIAVYYIILFATPLMLILMAAYFLKERLDWKHLTAVGIGFAGVIYAINPFSLAENHGQYLAYAVSFIIMIVFALQMLMLRVGHTDVPRESLVFYMRLFGFVSTLVIGFVTGFSSPSFREILICFVSGAFGAIGWLCMAEAYKRASTASVASLHYSQIITGALFGYMFWGDAPTYNLAIGSIIIVGSGIYVALHAQKAATKEALAESVES